MRFLAVDCDLAVSRRGDELRRDELRSVIGIALHHTALLLAVILLGACSTHVPAAAMRWSDAAPVFKPPAQEEPAGDSQMGWLRVETDRDPRMIGETQYYPRRSYDIYATDGKLLRGHVDNEGRRSGEEPRAVALEPGRYMIASVYGTVYRKLQVEVLAGLTTEVPEAALRDAPPVRPDEDATRPESP